MYYVHISLYIRSKLFRLVIISANAMDCWIFYSFIAIDYIFFLFFSACFRLCVCLRVLCIGHECMGISARTINKTENLMCKQISKHTRPANKAYI